jgi:hypothetical protein
MTLHERKGLGAAAIAVGVAIALGVLAYVLAPKIVVEIIMYALGPAARLWPGA